MICKRNCFSSTSTFIFSSCRYSPVSPYCTLLSQILCLFQFFAVLVLRSCITFSNSRLFHPFNRSSILLSSSPLLLGPCTFVPTAEFSTFFPPFHIFVSVICLTESLCCVSFLFSEGDNPPISPWCVVFHSALVSFT